MQIYVSCCSALSDYAQIGSFNIEAVTNITNILLNVVVPTADYDAKLVAWEAQNEPAGLTLTVGRATKFTLGSAAETARTALIANGWTMKDGGGI